MVSHIFSKKNILIFLIFVSILPFSCTPSPKQIKEANIHYEMGVLYYREGDFIRALQELVKASEINPSDKHIWNALGLAYRERKLYKESEEAFKKAISIDEKFSDAYNNLGVLYMQENRYNEAIKCFQQAVGNIFYTTPEFAYNNMGLAYQSLKNYVEAEKSFKEAVLTNPSFVPAYINLAKLYIEQNRINDAEKLLVKFLSVFENDVEGNFLLAKLYFGKGDMTKAKSYFEKVIKLDPRSPFANLAKSYLEGMK